MVRVWGTPVLTEKSLIQAVLLVSLALVLLIVLRQMHQTAAANSGPAVHGIGAQANSSSKPTSESSVSEDSLNSQASSGSGSSSSHTSLTVNGQDIPLPTNGAINQTITDGDTTTTINAQTSNSSSGSQGQASSSNNTSVNVQVDSNSKSETGL